MRFYPELTLVPADYANSKSSKLTIFAKENKILNPTIKDPFFILWLPLNLSEDLLTNSIKNVLPDFPIDKSITCTINLGYPTQFLQQNYPGWGEINSNSIILGNTIAKVIPLTKIINILAGFELIAVNSYQHRECSSSMYFWSLITKLIIQLIAKGSFIPHISRLEDFDFEYDYLDEKVGSIRSIWRPVLKSEQDINNFIRILEYAPVSAHNIPNHETIEKVKGLPVLDDLKEVLLDENSVNMVPDIWSVSKLSRLFIDMMVDSLVRDSTNLTLQVEGSKTPWEFRLLYSLLSNTPCFDYFNVKEEIIPGIFKRWSQKLNFTWDLDYSMKIHLIPPSNQQDESLWTMKFSLQSLLDDSHISLQEFWNLLKKIESQQILPKTEVLNLRNYVVRSLNILSGIFEPITIALKQKYPSSISILGKDVFFLLQTGLSKITSYGFSIEIPETFSSGGSQRIQPVLSIHSEKEDISIDHPLQSTSFDMSSILTYEWVLKVGDSTLTDEETNQLLNTAGEESLLFWNNQWIMVDKREINQFRGGEGLTGQISGQEALHLSLTQNAYFQPKDSHANGPYPVQIYGPLEEVMKMVRGKSEMPHLPQPSSFNGTLRKYQEYGFNWMHVLTSIGFGCVLADDMGLGKTIQVIALFLSILQEKKKDLNFLVICPTSVLGNWMRELKKFSPEIKAELHYGIKRAKSINALNKLLQRNDVILTSYNILRRDINLFEVIKWESVILDESQNIKNYKTKQAKAVYRLVEKTRRKIALSGTPIENKITELWSLYHFVNPFLLGTRPQFMKKYAIPVGKLGNESLTKELRNLVNPFLLRRMKTNKDIVPELPDKQETEVYIELTNDQKEHYKTVVEEMLNKVEALEENSKQKFKQKGLILKAIMQLKQICNHPDQFLHTSLDEVKRMEISDFIDKSGKLHRLIELLEEAIASKNKVLVFTQFKVMGDFLQYVIENQFNIHIPFIHGGVPQESRTRIVSQFQEDFSYESPILLLSLRAGGVGLNLSKASIVIHIDRWWNPAVEDQATDRAYRIGQESKVFVYKMVAEGTIEERISKMLEEKRALAEKIIKVTGEEWITELSFGELKDIFQLEEVES